MSWVKESCKVPLLYFIYHCMQIFNWVLCNCELACIQVGMSLLSIKTLNSLSEGVRYLDLTLMSLEPIQLLAPTDVLGIWGLHFKVKCFTGLVDFTVIEVAFLYCGEIMKNSIDLQDKLKLKIRLNIQEESERRKNRNALKTSLKGNDGFVIVIWWREVNKNCGNVFRTDVHYWKTFVLWQRESLKPFFSLFLWPNLMIKDLQWFWRDMKLLCVSFLIKKLKIRTKLKISGWFFSAFELNQADTFEGTYICFWCYAVLPHPR